VSLLSEALTFDLAKQGMDASFTDQELGGMSGLQEMRKREMHAIGRNPMVRDFLEVTRRGRLREIALGTAKDVADRMEGWFAGRACDGFVISATHVPGAYADFVRLVIPELQRIGSYHKDYAGPTLRDNRGLPRPGIGEWQMAQAAD
jgi:alkanesulfonate monooxygenase SsuD/methylene tetrahydromethanopterin reductase-like flavin-dependent oxidoreductase (luciferase family)